METFDVKLFEEPTNQQLYKSTLTGKFIHFGYFFSF
eukprot:UN26321